MPASAFSKYSYAAALDAGRVFSVTHEDEAVGASPAQIELLVRVAAGAGILLGFAFSGDGDFYGALYDGPTPDDPVADGTPLTVVARNRVDSITSSAIVFHTPTVVADGTKLAKFFSNAGHRYNALDPLELETYGWILAAGDYLVQWENQGATPTDAGIELLWIDL